MSRYLDGEDILNSDVNNNIDFHRVSKDLNSTSNNNSSLIGHSKLFLTSSLHL